MKIINTYFLMCLLLSVGVVHLSEISWDTEQSICVMKQAHAKKKKRKKRARRQERSNAGAFAKGNIQLSVGGGTAGSFGSNYVILGGSVGYFVMDGLAPSLGGEFWFGDDPSVSEVSPGVTYYVYQLQNLVPIVPYGGVFFERTWIGDSAVTQEMTINAYGARGGALYVSGRLLIGGGLRATYLMSCDAKLKAIYGACEDIGPELRISFSL